MILYKEKCKNNMEIYNFKSQLNFEFLDDEELMENLKKMYTLDGFTPQITFEGDLIRINIDEKVFNKVKKDMDKAIDLCNRHEFSKTEPLLKDITKRCPLHADAFRMLDQVRMDCGDHEDAFNTNIEALKINPTNLWALLLMGNICVKQKKIALADEYYNKVLEYHPDDMLAINNLAGNYLQREDYQKAEEMFRKIIDKDNSYLNSYYGLAMSLYKQLKLREAFEVCVEGMKRGIDRPQDPYIREELQKLVMTLARNLTNDFDYSIEIGKQLKKLEEMGSKKIVVDHNATKLPVSARLEYSVAHKRDYEKVLVKPNKKYHDHLMMHELMHLQMYLMAKSSGRNKLAVSGQSELEAFKKWIGSELRPLNEKLSEKDVKQVVDQLHNGLMTQALNSPLDLYVEAMIYRDYPEMRPLQMLSLVDMNIENIDSVKKAAKSIIPKKVTKVNRIMNLVNAIQLMELYGFNLGPHFGAPPAEMKVAKDLYDEWAAYYEDSASKPGDEYDLLEYFTQHLEIEEFFTMVNEMHFNDIALPNKENLPKESTDPETSEEQLRSFPEQHKDGADPIETMMMSMYMLGAMKDLCKD